MVARQIACATIAIKRGILQESALSRRGTTIVEDTQRLNARLNFDNKLNNNRMNLFHLLHHFYTTMVKYIWHTSIFYRQRPSLGDTRASHHTTYDMANFPTFRRLSTPYRIKKLQGEVNVTRCGTVNLIVQSARGPGPLQLKEVLYIPSMNFNLFSLQKVIKAKYIPVFDELHNKCVIKKTLPTGHKEQIAVVMYKMLDPAMARFLEVRFDIYFLRWRMFTNEVHILTSGAQGVVNLRKMKEIWKWE